MHNKRHAKKTRRGSKLPGKNANDGRQPIAHEERRVRKRSAALDHYRALFFCPPIILGQTACAIRTLIFRQSQGAHYGDKGRCQQGQNQYIRDFRRRFKNDRHQQNHHYFIALK
ncbi:MAG: hypothetical protein Q7T36_04025 [Fluviicoccus sp.]|uniref:hypothetical protein n=1 Tax=Fluviicoccus sp. TaxID=2003552 RepID=UPI002716B0F4|nr:hypothetical protein [Fluviicoccus sp.]MDO8329618.1 hypothetical protein [Fluviicoccus sp.]